MTDLYARTHTSVTSLCAWMSEWYRDIRDTLRELEPACCNAYAQACCTGQFVLPVLGYFRHCQHRPYSLKLLKLVFSERDALSYCTLYRAVKFNASGHNCSEACSAFGGTPAKMQAVVSVLDKNICSHRRSKSQRNLNTATTIAKSNFQGAAHNIIQKRTLP